MTSPRRRALLAAVAGSLASGGCALASRRGGDDAAITLREFIAVMPPTPQSHASTLVETTAGTLLAAWFAGTAERAPDVRIWLATRDGQGRWEAPRPVADGVQPDGTHLPTWNPVLFQPRNGPLLLFYKVGADPTRWWGELRRSDDDGRRWVRTGAAAGGASSVRSAASRCNWLTGRCFVRRARRPRTASGVSTSSAAPTWESPGGVGWTSRRRPAWRRSSRPWPRAPDGRVIAFARTRSDGIARTESRDGGADWSPLSATGLPNPNAGIEALALADGRLMMVCNPRIAGRDWWEGRDRLDVLLSVDDGRRWRPVTTLEDIPGQEFSYPAAIQTRDGRVHVSYTFERTHIRHVVLDPAAWR